MVFINIKNKHLCKTQTQQEREYNNKNVMGYILYFKYIYFYIYVIKKIQVTLNQTTKIINLTYFTC